MTHPDPQEAVRRLLAEARHDEPVPAEVATRLDAVLADLVGERSPGPLPPDPTDVAAPAPVDLGARRRRLAGVGLMAAAAVVVAGVAIGQALPTSSDDAGGAADSATSTELQGDGGASAQESAPEADAGGAQEGAQAPRSAAAVPALRVEGRSDAELSADLVDLRATSAPDTESGTESDTGPEGGSDRQPAPSAISACQLRGTGPGRQVLTQVDGGLGLVVLRPVSGGTQRADVYACGDGVPLRSVLLPAP